MTGRAAGLDAVGFASAEPFLTARRALVERRERGLHGGMQFTYRNPDRSTDPARILAGARSLVVGARRYLREDPSPPADQRQDQPAPSRQAAQEDHATRVPAAVGRYAWEDHYQALGASLEAVADELRAEGWTARVVIDDNALVDRAAAHRAGLGWYGRNTTILLPGAGSWYVLGSVVTDAHLPADEPVPDGCGSCRRCIDRCPTQALTEAGELDARRCLAWLLQAPGTLPAEHRVAVGDRLYGCDTCQEVCPVNRLDIRRRPPPGAGAGADATVDALELLAATDAEILARWGRWYLAARQPRWLRRNALVVVANTADPSDPAVIAAVERALGDPDPVLRSHAVWAAVRLGRADLVEDLAGDPDPAVRHELSTIRHVAVRSDVRAHGVPSWPLSPPVSDVQGSLS